MKKKLYNFLYTFYNNHQTTWVLPNTITTNKKKINKKIKEHPDFRKY